MASGNPGITEQLNEPVVGNGIKHSVKPRKNITRACDACKKRRTRCSGTLPCSRCSALSILCQFKTSYRRGGLPSPKPVATESVTDSEPSLTHDARSQILPATASAASTGGRVPDFGGHYIGPSSGITFLNRAWHRINQDFVADIPACPRELIHTTIFNYGDAPLATYNVDQIRLPSRESASRLVLIYFNQAVVTYRFLHRPSVELWLDEIYDSGGPLWDKLSKSQLLISKAAVVFLVFAVAMLQEGKRQELHADSFDVAQSEQWFGAAEHLLSIQQGPPRLEMIQARLVQCLYLISSSRLNRCMHILANVMYLLLAAGLHRKRPHSTVNPSFIEHECQKRAFWCAYVLDRYLCGMFGRPKAVNDEDIDQNFPEEINDEDMTVEGPLRVRSSKDCVLTASILHFRLGCIFSEMSREIYSILPIAEDQRLQASERISLKLEAWNSRLPPIFSTVEATSLADPFRRQSIVLQTAYAHAVVHANRPFLLVNLLGLGQHTSISVEMVLRNVRKCVVAAQTLVDMVNNLTDGNLRQAFWFTHYTSFCAVIVLYIYTIQQHHTFHRYPSLPPSPELLDAGERCQRSLAEASQYHCPSERYSIILEELRKEVYRQLASPPSLSPDSSGLSGSVYEHLFADTPSAGNDDSEPVASHVNHAYGHESGAVRTDESYATNIEIFPVQDWNWQSQEWLNLDALFHLHMINPASHHSGP